MSCFWEIEKVPAPRFFIERHPSHTLLWSKSVWGQDPIILAFIRNQSCVTFCPWIMSRLWRVSVSVCFGEQSVPLYGLLVPQCSICPLSSIIPQGVWSGELTVWCGKEVGWVWSDEWGLVEREGGGCMACNYMAGSNPGVSWVICDMAAGKANIPWNVGLPHPTFYQLGPALTSVCFVWGDSYPIPCHPKQSMQWPWARCVYN